MKLVSGLLRGLRHAYIDIKFLSRSFGASLDEILRPLLDAVESRVSDDVGVGVAISDDASSLAVLGFIRGWIFQSQLSHLQGLSLEWKTLS